jgi:hypothetical protein
METYRTVVLVVARACGIAIAIYGVFLILLGIIQWLVGGGVPADVSQMGSFAEIRNRALVGAFLGDILVGLAGATVYRAAPIIADLVVKGPGDRA